MNREKSSAAPARSTLNRYTSIFTKSRQRTETPLCRGWEGFTFAMIDKPRSPQSEQPPSSATRSLAEAGDAKAQFSLGFCFASEGSAPDYLQAAQWYQKAADQSHALAQFNLGVMYDRGQGILRDPVQSMMWIGKAAQLGDAGAQYMLGMRRNRISLAEAPEAALESRIEAYKWLQLAAAQGYGGSEAGCEIVALGMTHEEVLESRRRLAAFVVGASK